MTKTMRIWACLLLVGSVFVALLEREKWVTLPNGFVLKGRSLLSADFRSILAADVEFTCFDDRFLIVTSKTRGQGGLFDAETRKQTSEKDHPEIYQPGGLRYGPKSCNGSYTGWVGAGLLGGDPFPFQPSCDRVNRENPNLKDKAWLDRPCRDK